MAAAPPARADTIHLLNRLSFGPSPGEIQRVESLGLDAYIDEQLHPERMPLPPSLERQLGQLNTLRMTPLELIRRYRPRNLKRMPPAQRKRARQRAREPFRQASRARLLQAIYSPRQLEEVMVDFWFNHFNVHAGNWGRFWVGVYEKDAIRPYALGSFRDLLRATAHHPSMLVYLNNEQNTAPGSPGARGRYQGLNENYARELLELHTLGVKGGYTQADVVAAAKIFTGWGLPQRWQRPRRQLQPAQNRYDFYFDPNRHDYSQKTFLDITIPGQGVAEGERVLDVLATHPSTAQHISYKLAQYFVSDHPPDALVRRMAAQFLRTDGDIRAVLDMLFHSPEFWASRSQKFKTPYTYILSAIRASGYPQVNLGQVRGMMRQLSMPLYQCRTPDGYANTQTAWLNVDAVTRRLGIATRIARGMGRRRINPQQLANTLGNDFSPQTRTVLGEAPARLQPALMLGSPEQMYR